MNCMECEHNPYKGKGVNWCEFGGGFAKGCPPMHDNCPLDRKVQAESENVE